MSVDFLDLLPEHRTILEQALACYVPDDRVAGVMLYGSLAIGQGDEFSDIDLNILAVPKHRTELLTQAPETMRTFGDTLFVFRADHLSPTQVVAHYANHVKLDLDFVLSEELGFYAERRRHRVFKDSTGELAKVIERSAALSDHYEVTSDQLIELSQRFWPWCYYAAAKATRGELWEARAGLEFIRAWTLTRLAAWLDSMPPMGYRRIEHRVSPQWLAGWQRTLAAPQLEVILNGLGSLIELFLNLRQPLADRLSLAFDRAAETAMCRRLMELGVPLSMESIERL